MQAEIEKIIQADQAAQKQVAAAHAEAQKVRVQAQEKAKEYITQKEAELSALEKGELEKILSEARSKACRMLEDADRYLERLRESKQKRLDALLEDLLERVLKL